MIKKKLLPFSIFLICINYYIEKTIFHIQNTFVENNKDKDINTNVNIQDTIEGEILINNIRTLTINKGTKHGIKENQIVMGEKGFIGIITHSKTNSSKVTTFWWPAKIKLLLTNGKNSYGYLKSQGYYLYLEINNSENTFNDQDILYICFPNKTVSLGVVKKNKKKIHIIPIENILEKQTVLILKN